MAILFNQWGYPPNGYNPPLREVDSFWFAICCICLLTAVCRSVLYFLLFLVYIATMAEGVRFGAGRQGER
jgi:hypothetical protein